MFKGSSISRTVVSITRSLTLLAAGQATGNGRRAGCFVLYDHPSLMKSLRFCRKRLAVVCIGKWSCIREICAPTFVICFSVRVTGVPLQKSGRMIEKQAQINKNMLKPSNIRSRSTSGGGEEEKQVE